MQKLAPSHCWDEHQLGVNLTLHKLTLEIPERAAKNAVTSLSFNVLEKEITGICSLGAYFCPQHLITSRIYIISLFFFFFFFSHDINAGVKGTRSESLIINFL